MIFWILYALFEGWREGNYWHIKNDRLSLYNFKEHTLWTMQRALVLIAICQMDWLQYLLCALVFPFIHDGMYYHRRWQLNYRIYSKKWFAQSTTSTAFSTKFFTPVVRTGCFIVGIILWCYLIRKL